MPTISMFYGIAFVFTSMMMSGTNCLISMQNTKAKKLHSPSMMEKS
ncbi:MAG: hypothetical protein ACXW01_05725 [Methylobacter sp.]